MRVLITGGAGFIGSHLTEALLSRGDQVIILDDLSTGSAENIRHLRDIPELSYWIDSVNHKALLAELVDESDVIVHLAAAVGVRLIVESPVRTIETNVKATELVLEAALKKRKLVFLASTSEVYGKSTRFPFREEDDLVLGATDKGRWSYAASKALDEYLALAYWKEKKLPVIVGRFFNTIGPRQTGQYGMVVPNFVQQALHDQPMTVFGSGQQSRCFCHVGDTVAAILKLLGTPAAVGQVFNIGGTDEISMQALAELIRMKLRSKSLILNIPYAEAYGDGFEDMLRRVPSIEKIERCTGWQPSKTLDQSIDLIAAHLQKGRAPLTNRSHAVAIQDPLERGTGAVVAA